MSNVLSDWRSALVSALTTAFPDAEVKSGKRTGVSRDRDRINVFADPQPQGHLADRIVVATPRLVVRYWKRRSELPPVDSPADPTELEQARQDLEEFVETHQASLGIADLWFFQLETIMVDDDPDEWGVEAKLIGYGNNLAAIA
jgi:hypothetical protein